MLTAAIYLLSEEKEEDLTGTDIGSLMRGRVGQQYTVFEEYPLPERDIVAYGYRFQHTGDPVSQVVIFFGDADGRVFMLEVTGHRRDEELLVGEGRQLAHSIRQSRTSP